MGDSRSREPSEHARDAAPASWDDDGGFGGEPAEIVTPQLSWPRESDEPTRISQSPPIGSTGSGEALRPVDMAHSLVGQQLEHFEIEELVGGGGMGAVFRATDTRLNRRVAVKVLPREQSCDDEVVRRFRNEAQSAARLDHDNIARVYYVGEDRGLHFIAFEFIEGRNLRDLVQERGPLAAGDALDVTLQIAEALGHASDRDVVHRDIKPSNVLITPDGKAKLVDMGLARLHQFDRSSEDLTASGVTLGTFDYISPEQARDPRNADVRSDIYSLGCAVFFMLTGRPPFPDGTVLQKLLQHQGDEPPDPREFNSEVPAELCRVLRRMMAKEPRARYQSSEELIADLLGVANQLGLKTSTADGFALAESRERTASFVERHLPWMLPVAALVLVIAGIELSGNRQAQKELAARPEPAETPAAQPAPNARSRPTADENFADELPSGIDARQSATKSGQSVVSVPPRKADAPPRPATSAGSAADPVADPPTDSQPAPPATARPAQIESHDTTNRASAVAETSVIATPFSDGDLSVEASAGDLSAPPPPTVEAENIPQARAETGDLPPAATTRGVLVVEPGSDRESTFATLAAACAAARTGDIIELRWQGRHEEQPLELRNLRLTIRAGERYQPTLAFRETGGLRHSPGMINVSGGRLTLINVDCELTLAETMQSASLFALERFDGAQLEHCALTIRDPFGAGKTGRGVAFFTVFGDPSHDDLRASADQIRDVPTIQLQNCVARGDGNLVDVQDAQACTLQWNNGLLATSGRLLLASGSRVRPRSADQLRIDLRHVTADVRGGLCLLTNAVETPYQLPTEIKCANSILICDPRRPLIEQIGVDTVAELRGKVRWDSERNFYDGVRVFREIHGRTREGMPDDLTLTTWQAFWQGGERSWGRVQWKSLPDSTRPISTYTPFDYALDATLSENPAVHGATDGRDAGCAAELLPDLTTASSSASRPPDPFRNFDLQR